MRLKELRNLKIVECVNYHAILSKNLLEKSFVNRLPRNDFFIYLARPLRAVLKSARPRHLDFLRDVPRREKTSDPACSWSAI